MTPLFCISSSGASATIWLTKLLNLIPNVLCFHALRYNPFLQIYDANPSQGHDIMPPEQLAAGISQLLLHCWPMGERTIGVIHSYYGIEPRKTFLEYNGKFMCIIRNPISRFHSLFSARPKTSI